jgi:hypothetical protein
MVLPRPKNIQMLSDPFETRQTPDGREFFAAFAGRTQPKDIPENLVRKFFVRRFFAHK